MALEPPLWAPAVDPGDGVLAPQYSARQDRYLLELLFREGVVDLWTGGLTVRERAAGTNTSVEVTPGAAAIKGDDQAYQGSYLMRSTAVENLGVDPAPATGLSRVDRVVARVYDAGIAPNAESRWALEILTGAAVSSNPVAPSVPPTAISLATVGPIVPSTVAVTNSMITDTRPQASLSYPHVFDPGPTGPARPPSQYPNGTTAGLATVAQGWPFSGTVVTYQRDGTRVYQTLTQADNALARPAVQMLRYGYAPTGGPTDAWGPWTLSSGLMHAAPQVSGTDTVSAGATSFGNLANVGPTVQFDCLSGDIAVEVAGYGKPATSGSSVVMSFLISRQSNNTVVRAAEYADAIFLSASTSASASKRTVVRNLPKEPLTVQAKYRMTGAGEGYIAYRDLNVQQL